MFRQNWRKCCMVVLAATLACLVNQAYAADNMASGVKAVGVAPRESFNDSYVASERLGENRYALVVGINEYQDEDIPDLEKCVNDAKAMYETLANPDICGIPEENIISLYNEQATRTEILQALEYLSRQPSDSTIYIYYSGHGAKQQGEGFWLTHDCTLSSLRFSALPNRDLSYWLSQIKSEKVVCLIDCCFAAATVAEGEKSIHDINDLLKKFTGKGRAIFMASGDEEALEDQNSKYSIFTRHLLEGLHGKADANGDNDGIVVLTELQSYINSTVSDDAVSAGGHQRPVAKMEVVDADSFLVSVVPEILKQKILFRKQQIQEVNMIKEFFIDAITNDLVPGEFVGTKITPLLDKLLEKGALDTKNENKKYELLNNVVKAGKVYDLSTFEKQYVAIDDVYRNTVKKDDDIDLIQIQSTSGFGSKKDFKNCIGMDFKVILPGSFNMGTDITEKLCKNDETPLHQVKISRPFYLGVCEVTQQQWEFIMGSNPSFFKNPTSPVETVTWNDAKEFCEKLGQKDGRTYRLPTEAEWEYACRAGTSGLYHNDLSSDSLYRIAWCSSRFNAPRTKPVKMHQPNEWGLYDMHGNVSEWCEDWFGDYTSINYEDPIGPSSGVMRVIRGGCYSDLARDCRSASRFAKPVQFRSKTVGFRVLIEIKDSDLIN